MNEQIGKKLKALFDYQRFEQASGLQEVIDSTDNGIRKLSDDELAFAAGGQGGEVKNNRNPLTSGNGAGQIVGTEGGEVIMHMDCPTCGPQVDFVCYSGTRAVCKSCGYRVDLI